MSFVNEPTLELRRAAARDELTAALAELDRSLPLRVPILIGGDEGGASGLTSTDPGAPERIVAGLRHDGRTSSVSSGRDCDIGGTSPD